jgi:hypothetical protein
MSHSLVPASTPPPKGVTPPTSPWHLENQTCSIVCPGGRARRQILVQQLAVERLDLRRRDLPKWSCTQSWTDIPCEQARIVAVALSPQPRPCTDVEPVVEILAQSLPRGSDVATEVSLSEHVVEMGLCRAQPAADGFADVLAFSGHKLFTQIQFGSSVSCKFDPRLL